MKRIIAITLLICFVPLALFAQGYDYDDDDDHLPYSVEISTGYGYVGLVSFLGMLILGVNSVGANAEGYKIKEGSTVYFGIPSFSANIRLNDNWSIGLTSSGEFMEETWVKAGSPDKVAQLAVVTAMAGIEFDYGWENFRFYHNIKGGGSAIFTGNDPAFSWAFNITALGIKVFPTPNLGVYADIGAPFLGFINAGMILRL